MKNKKKLSRIEIELAIEEVVQPVGEVLAFAAVVGLGYCAFVYGLPAYLARFTHDEIVEHICTAVTVVGIAVVCAVIGYFTKKRRSRRSAVHYVSRSMAERNRRCLGYVTPEMICESVRRVRK